MKWEYVIVHDGDPRMDGSYQRVQIGRFDAFKTANRALETIKSTRKLAPETHLRIERRHVGPWEVVNVHDYIEADQ